MAGNSDRISRERTEAPPGPVYTETVLRPSYEFMPTHYFEGLLEPNKAWTAMLTETDVIPESTARGLITAVKALEKEGRSGMGDFNPAFEYVYSRMEHYLAEQVGETISGEINIGRTRPEPLARLAIRDRLGKLLDELVTLQGRLLALAEREKDTVMSVGTHMQHGQVAIVGHYLLGVVDQLQRGGGGLLAA